MKDFYFILFFILLEIGRNREDLQQGCLYYSCILETVIQLADVFGIFGLKNEEEQRRLD